MICRVFVVLLIGFASIISGDWFSGDCYATESSGISSKAERPAQSLTLKEAFVLGVENSRAVYSASYQPLKAGEDYNKARSIYDPSFFLSSSTERTDRPTRSTLDGLPVDSALLEDRWQVQIGIKSHLPTGGSVALYQEANRLESNSDFVVPDPQYQSRIITSFTQPLLKGLGDQEGATSIEVASLNRQISESAFKRDVTDVLMEIGRNYWQLYFEQNVARVTRESLARAQEVYQREKVRENQGLSKPVDVDRALVAMKTRKGNLLRAENQVRVITRHLWLSLAPNQMFDHKDVTPLEITDLPRPGFFSWPGREIMSGALNQRQELAIARDTVEISKRQQSLAQHNQLPVLDMKVEYGFNGLGESQNNVVKDPYDDDHNNWRVELAFEWPLGGRSSSAEKRKADYQLSQSKVDMRLAAERVAQEVDIVLDELRLAEEELMVTREAMESAWRVMKGEEVLFELGQKDNQDLLVVQDYYGSAEKESLRAEARYNLNLISLSRTRGTLMSDYGINLEVLMAAWESEPSTYR